MDEHRTTGQPPEQDPPHEDVEPGADLETERDETVDESEL
jgi:hypothetical protein